MKKKYFMGLLMATGISVNAQYGALDQTLDPGLGADNLIQMVALQDEKIIIGGDFLSYDGTSRKRIARLNFDGSLDPSFNVGSGANKLITDIVIQPDAKIIIVGEFTIFNNSSKKRIARLNHDGSIDAGFNPGFGANETILSCVLQQDGKIMIGGLFTSYNWIVRTGIARLNPDGSLDQTFNYNGDPIEAYDIRALDNGQYIVNAKHNIIRLNSDGSVDTSFYSGAGTDHPIHMLYVQNDGKILVGGYFTSYDNQSINRIVRLESNGQIDPTFNMGGGADYGVLAISEQPDGMLIISGLFSHYNGILREKIARIHPNGDLDESFNPELGPDNIVLSHIQQYDGRILLVGDFNSYNGISRGKIARVNAFESLSTFLTNATASKIEFWPNPASETLNFSYPENVTATSIRVSDLHGKILLESGAPRHLDVSSLSSGMYIISVMTETGTHNSKFIKK